MKIPVGSAVVLALALVAILPAGAQTRYRSQPTGTSVKIDGTSSMHDWEMEGSTIGGYIELGQGETLDKAQATPGGLVGDKLPAKGTCLIPVTSVHSKAEHLPNVMDDLMQKSMKASDYRLIEYTLTDLKFKGPHEAGKPFDFVSTGKLSIAGKTNTVSFPVTIDPSDSAIRVVGSAPIKMTDYGVEPPAPNFGLGMMKVGDAVTIKFDWTLKEKKK